jgi:hypothetical protein
MLHAGTLDWFQLLRRLKDHQVSFVIIGGIAAMLRGSPMGTFDLDVCAPMTDENLKRIHAALWDLRPKFRFRPDRMPLWADPVRMHGLKNLNLETDLGIIDLLGELPGVGSFEEIIVRATQMDVGGFTCPVVDLDTLITSKKVAGRDKDVLNVRHLEAIKARDQQQPTLFGTTPPPGAPQAGSPADDPRDP